MASKPVKTTAASKPAPGKVNVPKVNVAKPAPAKVDVAKAATDMLTPETAANFDKHPQWLFYRAIVAKSS